MSSVAAWHHFFLQLQTLGYSTFLSLYGHQEERQSTIRLDMAMADTSLQLAINLFYFGEPVVLSHADKVFGSDTIAFLCEYGILCLDKTQGVESIKTNGYRIIQFYGSLFLCELPNSNPAAYFGTDTFALGQLLHAPGKRVLDLCCGVGTHAIRLASNANTETVHGIDTSEQAKKLFDLNKALNGVAEKATFFKGDLFDALLPITESSFGYDTICCNPPLLPVPENVTYPYVGDGGEDGLLVTKKILEHLPFYLNDNGQAFIIGTTWGNEEGPFLDSCRQLCNDNGLSLTVYVIARESIQLENKMLQALILTAHAMGTQSIPEISRAYLNLISEQQATRLYSFLIRVCKQKQGPVNYLQIPFYKRNTNFWFV